MAYVITAPCLGLKDSVCVEVCPSECIWTWEDADQYFINPRFCIDCGLCQAVCPVSAIFHELDVPRKWNDFIEMNADFFSE